MQDHLVMKIEIKGGTLLQLNGKTLPLNGTLYKSIGVLRTKENSLLIFVAELMHSSPSYLWKGDRYVISADFIVK